MIWNRTGLVNSIETNTSSTYSYFDFVKKPIEMYVFIDPFCRACWLLEPYLKKMSLEYGRFFTIRPILSNRLCISKTDQNKNCILVHTAEQMRMSCPREPWKEYAIKSPWIVSLAIKAAELQGKKAGKVFLRKVQEYLFLHDEKVIDEAKLILCAQKAALDLEEFKNDLYSEPAIKALQCDIKLIREMEVDAIPSIVFFNQRAEDQGIKISGIYPYHIYVRILSEVLKKEPIPSEKPPLKNFVAFYGVISTEEISIVYDWSYKKAKREMKKLQLKQIVKRIPSKRGVFWKYNRQP